jgi:hypothetical protein
MPWPTARIASGNNEGKRQGKVEIGPYSKMPAKFFGSGTAASLGSSATLLFLALCEHANRHNANTFKASDRALASDTGLGTRTICDARKCLTERGMISPIRSEGESYTYTIPEFSFKWIPLAERPRQKQNPRALHTTRKTKL